MLTSLAMTSQLPLAGDDWREGFLSLSLIRSHTKTDDLVHVTDEQLRLYRAAAFESAEKYTPYLFERETIKTEVLPPVKAKSWRETVTYYLSAPASDGVVYYRGGGSSGTAYIKAMTRKVNLPLVSIELGRSCCSPCGGDNMGLTVTYKSGFKCGSDIPAGIIAGVLRWIAFSIQNPGDQIVTMATGNSNTQATSMGITGTNNVAWASGALEMWRQYNDDGY